MPAITGKPIPSRHKRVTLICVTCSKEYIQHEYRASSSKYCSKNCWSSRSKMPLKSCLCCKIFFKANSTNQIFCSKGCSGKYKIGEKSPRWKGGVSLKNDRKRFTSQLKLWREAVFKRDGFTCQKCNAEGSLHAHHIKSFSENEDVRFDINNGITLCIHCHGKEHGKDFSRRKIKKCQLCGVETKGRSKTGHCSSCAITLWHQSNCPQ